jgi:four helix bundle protein
MRRAAASVAANIAESCGRGSARGEVRFLHFAAGSAKELECQALLARDLGFLAQDTYQRLNDLVIETQRMLAALLRRAPKSIH